jgi:hypothetical protein
MRRASWRPGAVKGLNEVTLDGEDRCEKKRDEGKESVHLAARVG